MLPSEANPTMDLDIISGTFEVGIGGVSLRQSRGLTVSPTLPHKRHLEYLLFGVASNEAKLTHADMSAHVRGVPAGWSPQWADIGAWVARVNGRARVTSNRSSVTGLDGLGS